jgi:hypothetical protein
MSSMTPPPQGGAAPPQQAGGAPPSAAPANPQQQVLAQMYEVAKKLAQENPVISSGMAKVAEGIQEAQTAMLTSAPQTPPDQNPPY